SLCSLCSPWLLLEGILATEASRGFFVQNRGYAIAGWVPLEAYLPVWTRVRNHRVEFRWHRQLISGAIVLRPIPSRDGPLSSVGWRDCCGGMARPLIAARPRRLDDVAATRGGPRLSKHNRPTPLTRAKPVALGNLF